MLLVRILAVITLLVMPATAFSSFDFAAYKPASISQAYAAVFADAEADFTIESAEYKFAVIASYTGSNRPLHNNSRALLEKWAKSVHNDTSIAALFQHEIQVSVDGKPYWIPIQATLVQSFAQEIRAQARVKLFIMYVGAAKLQKLFIINEFQFVPPPPDIQIKGKDSPSMRVAIKSIDDGEMLWVGMYELATKALVTPGEHKISVACEFSFPGGKEIIHGDVSIDAETGKSYYLTGKKSKTTDRCDIKVKVR